MFVRILSVVRRASPQAMVLQGATIRSIAVSGTAGSKTPHSGAQETAPSPRRGKGVKVTTCPAAIGITLGQQMLAAVVQVRIIIRAEAAAIAAVAAVVTAAVAPAQSQPKEIPVVVSSIGKVFKVQGRLVFKVPINGYGGCDDHKLTISLAAIRSLVLLLLLLSIVALLVGQRVEQRLIGVH